MPLNFFAITAVKHLAEKIKKIYCKCVTGYLLIQHPMLKPSNTLTLVQIILSIARSQVGLSEIPRGSNWGKHVQKFLASVGIRFPAAWCMAFVYWVVNESCKELKIKNPLVKTGGCLTQWNSLEKRFKIVRSGTKWVRWDDLHVKYVATTIQPGDIGIMDFGGGKGHAFFVEKAEGPTVYTIEGNSNDEGSREGFEVCRKPGGRKISTVKGFIRLS